MLGSSVAAAIVVVSLGVFAWVGFTARAAGRSIDEYLVARNSQDRWHLSLSFLASGMGAWILFAPPEVGAGVGLVGVAGYALGAAGPFVAFALLGKRIRAVVPGGHSLTEFVKARFGTPFFVYVGLISIGYMLFFVTAELTAIGGVTEIVSGLDGRIAIVGVSVVTLAYTAYGGLRASLRTDQWQAWMILALVAGSVFVISRDLPSAGRAWSTSGLLGVDRLGVEVAATLIIAVVAANLFHQGYWQRVWAARDETALNHGAAFGALMTVPVVALIGILGILAAGSGMGLDSTPVPFFALLTSLPTWAVAGVLVLSLSLVASSVDTLENALASLVVTERPRTTLAGARLATVLLMIPSVFIALEGYSVLRLFLIADLLCAATVVPVLSGLWARSTGSAAFAGAIAGLVGAVVPGWITGGDLGSGVEAATFPGGIPTLAPFLWALVASASVTLAASLFSDRRFDLGAIEDRITVLEADL